LNAPPWKVSERDPRRGPADRAYRELPESERDLIRTGILNAGIHPRHHAYLAKLVLAELGARDGDKPIKKPRTPRELAAGHAAKIARDRILTVLDRVQAERASTAEDAHRERGRPRRHGGAWDNNA
jgi:hypothetical protein